jgi:hypothetical protein
LRRSSPGSRGAGQRFLLAHQVSQDITAARLRFHVAGARVPPQPTHRGRDLVAWHRGDLPPRAALGD